MGAQGFLAALAPVVTDAQARESFFANPRAVLAAAGLDLPEWFTVSAREGKAAELTITPPGLIDPDPDLSQENFEAVSGGFVPDAEIPPRNLHMALDRPTGFRWPNQWRSSILHPQSVARYSQQGVDRYVPVRGRRCPLGPHHRRDG